MSDKRYDSKNRWRNKSIAFRGSPEEAAELDKRWRLCGYSSKQDYLQSPVFVICLMERLQEQKRTGQKWKSVSESRLIR